ncbi:MAG: AmmeMemoRadiSam system radical SAM enzyme [Nitrososphaerales archaeon]
MLNKTTSLLADNLRKASVKETHLFEKIGESKVRCCTCERRCLIPDGGKGFCGTKYNIAGKLYTITYGSISSISINPIEKKPFYHYWPGSKALTIGTWSCNFTCPWCQNYSISKKKPKQTDEIIEPKALVKLAEEEGCQGISFSFNEPTLFFEYALDVFPLAKKRGLYCHYVSNGYMSAEALRLLVEAGMDAIKVDIKGSEQVVKRFCGAFPEPIWRNIGLAKELGLHVEVVFLLIPNVNDNIDDVKEIARRVRESAGEDTPLHITRFYPAYKMLNTPPTPISTLEAAVEEARKVGLNFVYIGNVAGHEYENTHCPTCKTLLIERYGFTVTRYFITPSKKCPNCGESIPIVGEPHKVIR